MEGEEKGKDGTVWIKQSVDNNRIGYEHRMAPHWNRALHLTSKAESTEHSTAFIVCEMQMLQHIKDCTVAEARQARGDNTWDKSVDELEAFIALLYVRGLYVGMNTPLESFWNEKYGVI